MTMPVSGCYERETPGEMIQIDIRKLGRFTPLTHAFLSIMLGTRRPGVTLAVQMLEGVAWIKATRAASRCAIATSASRSRATPTALPRRNIPRCSSTRSGKRNKVSCATPERPPPGPTGTGSKATNWRRGYSVLPRP